MVESFNSRADERNGIDIGYNGAQCKVGGILAAAAIEPKDDELILRFGEGKTGPLDADALVASSLTYTTRLVNQTALRHYSETQASLVFTGGFASPQAVSLKFIRDGNIVHCQFPSVLDTGDGTTTFTVSGDIPAGYRPKVSVYTYPFRLIRNAPSTVKTYLILQTDAGQSQFTIDSPAAPFTGQCGWNSFTIFWHAA